jgi:HPt (histidine-containing phosphotransfer) domain-containing protein
MIKNRHPVDGAKAIDPLMPTTLQVEVERPAKPEGVLLEPGAPKRTDGPPECAVSFPDLLTRVGNDRELVRELFEIFKTEFPHLLESLRESVRCGHMKQVETTSHTLKGMLSSLSATRAAAAAVLLEQKGRDEERPGLGEALANFEDEVTDLLAEVDAYLAGAQP